MNEFCEQGITVTAFGYLKPQQDQLKVNNHICLCRSNWFLQFWIFHMFVWFGLNGKPLSSRVPPAQHFSRCNLQPCLPKCDIYTCKRLEVTMTNILQTTLKMRTIVRSIQIILSSCPEFTLYYKNKNNARCTHPRRNKTIIFQKWRKFIFIKYELSYLHLFFFFKSVFKKTAVLQLIIKFDFLI